MKRFYLGLFVILLFLVCGGAFSAEKNGPENTPSLANPYVNSYPFKSVIIKFKNTTKYGHGGKDMSTYDGTEVMYIEGQKTAYEIKMTAPAPKGETKQIDRVQVITPDYIYYIDRAEDRGIKVNNAKKYGNEKYEKLTLEEKMAFHDRMERRGIVSLDLLGLGKKVGTDKILGRECDVYEYGEKPTDENFMAAVQAEIPPPYYKKSWIWREAKLPLKVITEQMGSQSELTAIDIEENVDIPAARFEIPEGIRMAFDEDASEGAKKETLARFNLYKTGQAMMLRIKPETEQVLTPEGKWIPSDSPEGKKILEDQKGKTETSSKSE